MLAKRTEEDEMTTDLHRQLRFVEFIEAVARAADLLAKKKRRRHPSLNEFLREADKVGKGPMFLLVFGGLATYGGESDFFLFLQNVLGYLEGLDPDRFVTVGAQEIVRLARAAGERRR